MVTHIILCAHTFPLVACVPRRCSFLLTDCCVIYAALPLTGCYKTVLLTSSSAGAGTGGDDPALHCHSTTSEASLEAEKEECNFNVVSCGCEVWFYLQFVHTADMLQFHPLRSTSLL